MNVRPPPAVDALDADGRIVRLRPITPGDLEALITMHERCSASDLRDRLLGSGRGALAIEAGRLISLNETGEGVAVTVEDEGRLLGAASFSPVPDHPGRAEFGVLVVTDDQHCGLGTLMLEHLALAAAAAGIKELSGQVRAGNPQMLRLAKRLVPGIATPYQGGVVDLVVATEFDEALAEEVAERERASERMSLRPLLDPASVAVVGASRTGRGVGAEVLRAIVEGEFTGPVYPIHPDLSEAAGHRAWPSLAEVPDPVDLVVVAVPAPAVADVLREAGAAGVRGAVVISSGFAEVGDVEAQDELVRIARSHDMRLVGPNSLGIVNTDRSVRLQASFASAPPAPGGLSLAAQSGAVGIAALAHATRAGLGVHSFVSLGNKADVSGNDLLAYWYDDPGCKAVALYLESFGNPRKFARLARAVARRKPVLAVKGGRSGSGPSTGFPHTAAATSAIAVESLFAQSGVIRCDTLEQLLGTARVLIDQPLSQGRRLGVVGNGGGVGVLAADAAQAAGLEVPGLSGHTRGRLAKAVPDAAVADNPIDLAAAAGPEAFAEALACLGASREVDVLLAVVAATGAGDVEANLNAIARSVDALPGTPAAVVVIGSAEMPTSLGARRIPVFEFPETAVAALGRAAAYAQWRTHPLGKRPQLQGIDRYRARAIVERLLEDGNEWQTAAEAATVLRCYGIPLAPTITVTSKSRAVAAARTLGYPVAVKADVPGLVHKTEAGAARLDLRRPREVRAAFKQVAATVKGDKRAAVVLQPMLETDLELAAGIVHDPRFGSLVMLGLAGTATEFLGDRQYRLLPLTDTDAESMWRSLKSARLLTGYRGSRPVDLDALTDMLARLGRLAEDLPEIAELDLSPLLNTRNGLQAVDVRLRLARIGYEPDPVARRLR